MNSYIRYRKENIPYVSSDSASINKYFLLLFIILFPLFQVTSQWFYFGSKVDESELVLFAVGFLGGDLDPVWNKYGHLGMYIMGFVYYVIGSFSILIGKFESLTDYAVHSISSGHFFVTARVVMAVSIMISVAICTIILSKTGVRKWVSLFFVCIVSISPTTIHYANYIRTDTLVMLFVMGALYFALIAVNFRQLIYLALCVGAAIACKISSIMIGGILLIALAQLLVNQRISWRQTLIVLGVLMLSLIVFSPYMDYPGLIGSLISSEYGSTQTHMYRLEYDSLVSKIGQISKFHVNAVGEYGAVLAMVSLAGLFSPNRRVVAYIWIMFVLTILPYLFGTTLRDYWFLPSYMLLALLAFISIGMLINVIELYLGATKLKSVVLVGIAGFLLLPLKDSLASYTKMVERQRGYSSTNQELAREWLADQHLGINPILIDRHFVWIYPKVYDSAQLKMSRSLSQLFIYERQGNKFLSSVFEQIVYPNKHYSKSQKTYKGIILKRLRIDFEDRATYIVNPKVCSSYSGLCQKAVLVNTHNVRLISDNGLNYSIEILGDDPHISFDVGSSVAIDGSHYVSVGTNSTRWQLFYDFGDGFNVVNQTRFFGYSLDARQVPIRAFLPRPWVSLFGVNDRPFNLVGDKQTILFVTSPWGYGRFNKIAKRNLGSSREGEVSEFLSWYAKLMKNKPIKVFKSGAGPFIEIYELPDSAKN